jgi:hypothetical protein
MLGGMEEDPEVGDPPLAKLVGLDFGLPSSEDTVSCMLHQLLLLALLFFGFNNLVSPFADTSLLLLRIRSNQTQSFQAETSKV